jgi:predicted ATP-grasp superfamily ATP-dependent carboligase
MMPQPHSLLTIHHRPHLKQATLVLAFTGWMDGGDVSTGTISRLVHLLGAKPIAEIDPEPFYILNFPGSMEVAAMFRPTVQVEEGLIKSLEMPSNTFYANDHANLALFIGKEPNLGWRTFGECIALFAKEMNVQRILFVGSFGGAVPHTREPRMYLTCSDPELLGELEQFAARRTAYSGPASFINYLLTKAESGGLKMASLVAEIPSYLEGTNPMCIEAVTRRLAKILKLPLDLVSLRAASTEWELQVSSAIEQNAELAKTVCKLEEAYDNDLLEQNVDEES